MIITANEYVSYKNYCRFMIAKNCVIFGNFKSQNGSQTINRMFLMRRMLFNVDFIEKMSLCMLYKIESKIGNFNFQIGGLETGSTPLSLGLSYVAKSRGIKINSFSVRKKRKSYGTEHVIEGILNNKPILVCDDLINSFSSIKNCKKILQKESSCDILPFEMSPLVRKPLSSTINLFVWSDFTSSKVKRISTPFDNLNK